MASVCAVVFCLGTASGVLSGPGRFGPFSFDPQRGGGVAQTPQFGDEDDEEGWSQESADGVDYAALGALGVPTPAPRARRRQQ